METTPITVALFNKNPIELDTLQKSLKRYRGIKVVCTASDEESLIEKIMEKNPLIILFHLNMLTKYSNIFVAKILDSCPAIKIILYDIPVHLNVNFIIAIGIKGFVDVDSPLKELVYSIKHVMVHPLYISTCLTEILVKDYYLKKFNVLPTKFKPSKDKKGFSPN